MIGVDAVSRAAGVFVGFAALANARDATNPKRARNAGFWGCYAITLLFGDVLPHVVSGCLVITMALVAGLGGLGRGEGATTSDDERAASAASKRNLLFLPALLVPGLTLAATFGLRHLSFVETKNVSLVALASAAILAAVVAVVALRQPARAPLVEGRRLLDLVGWAAVLPQMLAMLGTLFAAAGVGDRIAELLGRFVPLDQRFVAVAAYTLGMALFTVVMGNAFAAFPVMTAAIGIPILVKKLGGDPAIVAAIGMLSGFCGTLMTPMAANFNVVPAALLDLPDKNGVIRAQIPTALLVLAANTALMYLLLHRR
ncbi:MAG: DUF979 domain-containing protein [Deltaproteobacteria bacterium]|nr:DUF979 domain-containing protein [Deltaproteobacteria bacterium]